MACERDEIYQIVQSADTDFDGNHFLFDYIISEVDLADHTAQVDVPKAHFKKDLTLVYDTEQELYYVTIDFSAEETEKMPLGDVDIIVTVYNAEHKQQSLKRIPIKVLRKGSVISSTAHVITQGIATEDGEPIYQGMITAPYNHDTLRHRDYDDQHPISSITGLDSRISEVEGGLAEETRERAAEDTRIEGLFSGYLPTSTLYGATLVLDMNTTTYVLTATLKDQNGNTLGTAQTIDLPIESTVVGGSYDSENKKIVLTLQSGSTVDIPIGDLVEGLQNEITSSNKLSADLVDDTNTTNKFVTADDKTNWNGKQDAFTIGTNLSFVNDELSTIATQVVIRRFS